MGGSFINCERPQSVGEWLSSRPGHGACIADQQVPQGRESARPRREVEVALGSGSPPAAQAVSAGQFDVGIVGASVLVQQVARGLNLVALGTTMYDTTFALAVPVNSPIRTAKDLEGRRLGGNPRGADFAFWPAYARLAGLDVSRIQVTQLDPAVVERTLSQGQVDAVTCVASSSLPTFQALNFPVRFIMWRESGLQFYHNTIVTRPEVLRDRAPMLEAVCDGLFEAIALTLRDPEAALAAFIRQRPEIGISDQSRGSARLGQGLLALTTLVPEAMEHGLGHSDMAVVERMINTVMEFSVPDGRRPVASELYTNRFAGRVKLTPAEWQGVRERVAPFAQALA
jgi:ABC-type nitrate/sulfonate/bicarbonate transport system substrate-binding protein